MPRRVYYVAAATALFVCMNIDAHAHSRTVKRPRGVVPISWNELVTLAADMSRPHEGIPAGVPADYSWARKPRIGAGNDPRGFTAFTGWGQAFQVEGGSVAGLSIRLRDMRVLVCYGLERQWALLQHGPIEGAQFRADFKDNYNEQPSRVTRAGGETTVRIADGTAYHFWAQEGRAQLPAKQLCGIVVLVQAAVAPDDRHQNSDIAGQNVLLGLGADYWKDRSAQWDNYQSNCDVAIGRLKVLGRSWRWYGLTTASIPDLRNLYRDGYALKASSN